MKRFISYLTFFLGIHAIVLAENQFTKGIKLFEKWDKNNDGSLTFIELPSFAQKNFDKVDLNKNQSISIEEHLTFLSHKEEITEKKTITIHHDLAYAGSKNPRQTLDLILATNQNPEKLLPLVIWIHGGGWKNGDKKTGHSPNRIPEIVKTGRYAGAAIGYRLSGEAIWPAQIHDCKAAIRWLKASSKKFGYNANKIAIWGSSAGGHLASMLGTTGDKKEFEGKLGNHLNQSSQVQAVINYYGPSALLQMNDYPSKIDHNAPNSPESELMGFPIQKFKNKTRNASPLYHAAKNHVSFIHFHGTDDPLVPFHQSYLFHQALQKKGVKSTLITLDKGKHSMPPYITEKYVIPFLDFTFYLHGKAPADQKILKD